MKASKLTLTVASALAAAAMMSACSSKPAKTSADNAVVPQTTVNAVNAEPATPAPIYLGAASSGLSL